MIVYRPDQIRSRIATDVIGSLTPSEDVKQVATDVWLQAQAPFGPSFGEQEIERFRHLLYHVEISDAVPDGRVHATGAFGFRATIRAYAWSAIRNIGNREEVNSASEALRVARELWRALKDAAKTIPGITMIPVAPESLFGIAPFNSEWYLARAVMPVKYDDFV